MCVVTFKAGLPLPSFLDDLALAGGHREVDAVLRKCLVPLEGAKGLGLGHTMVFVEASTRYRHL